MRHDQEGSYVDGPSELEQAIVSELEKNGLHYFRDNIPVLSALISREKHQSYEEGYSAGLKTAEKEVNYARQLIARERNAAEGE